MFFPIKMGYSLIVSISISTNHILLDTNNCANTLLSVGLQIDHPKEQYFLLRQLIEMGTLIIIQNYYIAAK